MKTIKRQTLYQQMKSELISFAKGLGFEDKPARRMMINDEVDCMTRSLPASVSDKERDRIKDSLSEVACLLHDFNSIE